MEVLALPLSVAAGTVLAAFALQCQLHR
jgi:hypothetical protein